ncbi:thiamine ABC transporter ATP-binding protein [Vibrio algivorus]|uniref:Thiamine ABC transporter ATP-binding protein n=1 Tax=Vibrio algivorus TaxID=1667024 RepID=A0A557PCY4_9VIBR|nr:thiamine ABC transporter ATP-binding protein [Vibrio algivorus]TVO38498.1 thiamine ABC transporter ATP-binding protein [Vibrio algivorus]GLT15192.1 thiamine import ATP-binding protein ThiQ [Vibrio algivorus]
MSDSAIEIQQVIYDYQKETFHFDLQVERGSIMALMGPSGSGKSTLLSLIAGFIEPKQGKIKVDGLSVIGLQPHQRPLAMLFQEHNLFSHLTVRQNIGLGLHPGLKLTIQQKQQVESAAHQVGIVELLERLPEQLSGGQRQRVALARCFVQTHSIWLLDEPFSALDPILRQEMLSLVASLAKERNITVLMVTHHLSDAKSIGSHFAFMEQGQVTECDQISQLTQESSNAHLRAFLQASGN